MYKVNVYAKMEKLEAEIRRFTRQGLKVMPCLQVVGCCATWRNMPAPLPCWSSVAFKPLEIAARFIPGKKKVIKDQLSQRDQIKSDEAVISSLGIQRGLLTVG